MHKKHRKYWNYCNCKRMYEQRDKNIYERGEGQESDGVWLPPTLPPIPLKTLSYLSLGLGTYIQEL